MYSIVCRKVNESKFTLAQIQKSVKRARHILDHERIELTPDLMDKLLLEREKSEHKGIVFQNEEEKIDLVFLVPFIPLQPIETLKSGNMYLKSIDKNHRRYYEKLVDSNQETTNSGVQQLYVRDEYRFFKFNLNSFL
jgi:hypothetical protein